MVKVTLEMITNEKDFELAVKNAREKLGSIGFKVKKETIERA
jgi:hypothetical protein